MITMRTQTVNGNKNIPGRKKIGVAIEAETTMYIHFEMQQRNLQR
jgi:hypothetical protein